MQRNYLKETAAFTLAQDVLESVHVMGEGPIQGKLLSKPDCDRAALKCIGRELTEKEEEAFFGILIQLMPEFDHPCIVFALAHDFFHMLED